jgi:saccharopine dehydrogenase-like NADP-dependent oxidoreductase
LKALVLGGGGMMGREVVRDLSRTSEFDRIIVADKDATRAQQIADSLKDNRLRAVPVDVTVRQDVQALLRDCDVVANCTSYHYGLDLVRDAIACRKPYVDLGGLYNTPRQLELGPDAEKAGVPIVLGWCRCRPSTAAR